MSDLLGYLGWLGRGLKAGAWLLGRVAFFGSLLLGPQIVTAAGTGFELFATAVGLGGFLVVLGWIQFWPLGEFDSRGFRVRMGGLLVGGLADALFLLWLVSNWLAEMGKGWDFAALVGLSFTLALSVLIGPAWIVWSRARDEWGWGDFWSAIAAVASVFYWPIGTALSMVLATAFFGQSPTGEQVMITVFASMAAILVVAVGFERWIRGRPLCPIFNGNGG